MRNIIAIFLFVGGINLAAAGPTVTGSPPILPNPKLTPGSNIMLETDTVCVVGYTKDARHVTPATRKQVFASYGITPSGDYELDHLVSLELGGSNDATNLWPQSYKTEPWNARVKDKLENKLHKMVCDGQMTLKEAQDKISKDWIKSYCEVFNDEKCNGDAK